jgi:hypothetical protein
MLDERKRDSAPAAHLVVCPLRKRADVAAPDPVTKMAVCRFRDSSASCHHAFVFGQVQYCSELFRRAVGFKPSSE